jgi:hypothetical protein
VSGDAGDATGADAAGTASRAVEGLEHLQAAALELIAAARALLDVAEDVVREPGVAATVVQAAASLGRVFIGTSAAPPPAADDPPGGGRVRRIHVS